MQLCTEVLIGAAPLNPATMRRRIVEQSLELYTCSASSPDSEMPVYARNGTIPRAYNELATLMSVTGVPPIAAGHPSLCGAFWGAMLLFGPMLLLGPAGDPLCIPLPC